MLICQEGAVFIDVSRLAHWGAELERINRGKMGRNYVYPNTLFYLTGFLNTLLPFRQCEGFLRALARLKTFRVPDYTTIFRRVRRLGISLNVGRLQDGFVVAIDASGIRVTSRGEWMRERYGRRRRGWLKLHLAVSTKSRRLVGVRVTDERVHDSSQFRALLAQVLSHGRPARVLADSAYDSRANFNALGRLGIVPGIKPRPAELGPPGWRRLRARQ